MQNLNELSSVKQNQYKSKLVYKFFHMYEYFNIWKKYIYILYIYFIFIIISICIAVMRTGEGNVLITI